MKEILSQLAAQIRKARKDAGLTQKQLAEKMGIYESALNRIELRPPNLTIGTLLAIAKATGKKLIIRFVKK